MKIVLIHGQEHKGSTWNVANILLNNISCDKEVEEFFLPRDLDHFCLGCYRCIEGREKCPYWEEKKRIDDAILKADLLIFTTPTYRKGLRISVDNRERRACYLCHKCKRQQLYRSYEV